MSRGEAREEEDAMLTSPAMDRYTVLLWEQRASQRFEHWPKLGAKYANCKPEEYSPDKLLDRFFGPGTADNGKPPIFYVYMDPAGGGTRSDCVIITFIARAEITPEQVRLVQGNGRTWRTASGVNSYMNPVDVLVR